MECTPALRPGRGAAVQLAIVAPGLTFTNADFIVVPVEPKTQKAGVRPGYPRSFTTLAAWR